MLDIRFVRENIDLVNKAMESRNFTWDSKRFLQLDEDRRSAIAQEEALLSQRNTISKSIGALMGEGKKEEAEAAKAEVAKLKEKIAYYADLHEQAESALNELILAIPNIPSETTPIGKDEDDNPEVRRWGTPPAFDFEFKAHWDLGVDLGIIDFERAVKLAESRFVLLGGLGARLERALISFMADTHVSRGYKEWWCPVMANAKTLTGTGQLPKFEEDLFKTTEGLYLIPTAEVQLTNIHAGEVLDAGQLPRRGRQRRSRYARTHSLAPVRQGRDGQVCQARRILRRPRSDGRRRGEYPPAAWLAVSRDQSLHGRSGLLGCEDLRSGSVAAFI